MALEDGMDKITKHDIHIIYILFYKHRNNESNTLMCWKCINKLIK